MPFAWLRPPPCRSPPPPPPQLLILVTGSPPSWTTQGAQPGAENLWQSSWAGCSFTRGHTTMGVPHSTP